MDYKTRFMNLVRNDKVTKVIPKDDINNSFWGYRYIGKSVDVIKKHDSDIGFYFRDYLNLFEGDSGFIAYGDIDYVKTLKINGKKNSVGW